jgi:hypothetical protein
MIASYKGIQGKLKAKEKNDINSMSIVRDLLNNVPPPSGKEIKLDWE